MTLEEFQEKYCSLCGTQRCLGVYDEELREGCQHYREVFSNGCSMTFDEALEQIASQDAESREIIKAARMDAEKLQRGDATRLRKPQFPRICRKRGTNPQID